MAPPTESERLVRYIEEHAGVDVHGHFIITAAEVHADLLARASQYIIDIRSPEDFSGGSRRVCDVMGFSYVQ